MRRSVGIPRGFLRYGVLKLLSLRPMSGSELMESIEKRTGWRPSPGSIYPLLARLREDGFIEEVEPEKSDLRRFVLTKKGEELLKEYERKKVFMKKFHSIRRMWLKILMGMNEDLYRSSIRLFESIERITPYLREENADEVSEKVCSILAKAAEDLERLRKSLEANGR